MSDKTEGTFTVPGSDNDEDHLIAYCNSVAIAHTLFDFQLNFIESRIVDNLQSKVDLFATIMMSPQHAKVFYKSLETNIQMYEEQFGEIAVPEALYKKITQIRQANPQDEPS